MLECQKLLQERLELFCVRTKWNEMKWVMSRKKCQKEHAQNTTKFKMFNGSCLCFRNEKLWNYDKTRFLGQFLFSFLFLISFIIIISNHEPENRIELDISRIASTIIWQRRVRMLEKDRKFKETLMLTPNEIPFDFYLERTEFFSSIFQPCTCLLLNWNAIGIAWHQHSFVFAFFSRFFFLSIFWFVHLFCILCYFMLLTTPKRSITNAVYTWVWEIR